jgi:hypothetical protein
MQYQVLESKLESGIGNELFPLPTCTFAAWQTVQVITFFLHFSAYFHFVFLKMKTKM